MHNNASFSFDTLIDRSKIDSLKWRGPEGELPMWVADMDFETAPAITHELQKRLENATFGYSVVPDAYRQSVARWWKERHGITFNPEYISFSPGVIPALTSAIKSLTNVGERVVVNSPVYNNFYTSIANTGRRVAENRLVYEDGAYRIDFADLEQHLADVRTTLLILCNPHNPAGVVWSADDLARIGDLCAHYRVTVISDEIHCDVIAPGVHHVPFAAASQTCRNISVTLGSPSKAFNIAGLQTAYVIADDLLIRNRVVRGLNNDEVAEPNCFATRATIAAYDESAEWLDELCAYIQANKVYAADAINRALDGVVALDSKATYLLWIDCCELLAQSHGATDEELNNFLRTEVGLVLSPGSQYGSGGEGFVRMNLGTQRTRVEEGVRRFIAGCELFRNTRNR